MNVLSTCVLPSLRADPDTFTFLASPTSLSPTFILKGELAMCLPRRFTDTVCSPTSRGVNDIPAKQHKNQAPEQSRWLYIFTPKDRLYHASEHALPMLMIDLCSLSQSKNYLVSSPINVTEFLKNLQRSQYSS